jgi:hypothetical protein
MAYPINHSREYASLCTKQLYTERTLQQQPRTPRDKRPCRPIWQAQFDRRVVKLQELHDRARQQGNKFTRGEV